ncbi:MAG: hypothetical protein HY901_01665 [Deltaproteobacteria bacterium]|nr:hypothetical protein [Deltaproteobacteria bacterium]
MFQELFQAQSQDVLIWPLVAMFLFIAVFTFQLVRIIRTPRQVVLEHARLPLADDAAPCRSEGGDDER